MVFVLKVYLASSLKTFCHHSQSRRKNKSQDDILSTSYKCATAYVLYALLTYVFFLFLILAFFAKFKEYVCFQTNIEDAANV